MSLFPSAKYAKMGLRLGLHPGPCWGA